MFAGNARGMAVLKYSRMADNMDAGRETHYGIESSSRPVRFFKTRSVMNYHRPGVAQKQ